MKTCHICKGALEFFDNFSAFNRVTSDCRPWRTNGSLGVCTNCGIVQKPITPEWSKEAGEIYSTYDIFSQAGGTEQSNFNEDTGAGLTRSNVLVNWLASLEMLPAKGKLLDVGCGKGAFLKAFGNHFSHWEMQGFDLDSREKEVVESIPGVTALNTGNIENLTDKFELISLIHSLEHIPDPISYVASLKKHLTPDGLIFIQVPHVVSSPFDILVADHCTHYDHESLSNVMKASGYTIVSGQADYVPKELSFLSKQSDSTQTLFPQPSLFKKNKEIVLNHIEWLGKLLAQTNKISGHIGVFGTSIAGSWLAACVQGKVDFFVDEDVSRIGRRHNGIEILSPGAIDDKKTILFPMKYESANSITKRLNKFIKNFELPPQ